jgi:hypothetical protein
MYVCLGHHERRTSSNLEGVAGPELADLHLHLHLPAKGGLNRG